MKYLNVTPVKPGLFLSHLGRNPRKLTLRAFLLLVLLFVLLGTLTAMQVAVQRRVLCWTAGWHWNKNLTGAEVAAFFSQKGNCSWMLLNIHEMWASWGLVCAAAANSAGKLWLNCRVVAEVPHASVAWWKMVGPEQYWNLLLLIATPSWLRLDFTI